MTVDPELRDKIVETHTNMQHVLESLDGGKDTFRVHDKRLRDLEQNQSKIMTYIVAIGSAITIGMNGVLWLAGKIWK